MVGGRYPGLISDSSTSASRRRNRASWVALRTLRQVPKIVGETRAGEAIYEIRSVQLVLRGDASHFSRIVACSKCANAVPGPPVLSPADLDQPLHAVICKDCVRAGTSRSTPGPGVGPTRTVPGPPPSTVTDIRAAGRPLQDDPRLVALERRVAELSTLLDVETRTTRAELATADAGAQQLTRRQEELGRAIEVGREAAAAVTEVTSDSEGMRRLQEEMQRALGGVMARVHQLQLSVEAAQAQLDAGAVGQPNEELTRIEDQVSERLDRLAERAARLADSDDLRLTSLERQVRDSVEGSPKAIESLRRDTQRALHDGLSEVRMAITAQASESAVRLDALETAAAEGDSEVDDLYDFHAALDTGMGQLRSELARVSAATSGLTDAQADLQDRLDDLVGAQRLATAEPGLGRRASRQSAESPAELAAVLAAVDDLVGEHQQLRAEVAKLDRVADAATAAAARASAQASTFGPVRSDVRALHEQVAAQNEALAALTRSVEALRRKVPGRAPAAKKASGPAKS